MLFIVGQKVKHHLCHGWNVAIPLLQVEHTHLALQGDNTGIHLSPLTLAFELTDDMINLIQSLVGPAYLGECHAYLRLGAQGFGFQPLLPDEV